MALDKAKLITDINQLFIQLINNTGTAATSQQLNSIELLSNQLGTVIDSYVRNAKVNVNVKTSGLESAVSYDAEGKAYVFVINDTTGTGTLS